MPKKQTPAGLSTSAEIAADINKQHGIGTIVRGSDVKRKTLPRMTSGSLAVDVALGGGWPANQWAEIIGRESSGKTALALKTVAANQALDPDWTCVWVAAEHFVVEWAEALGVDLSRIIVVEDNIMEVGYEAAERYAESRSVDAVVLDSLPAMVPSDEAGANMEDMQVGVGARLTNKFFRRIGKAMKRSLVEDERPILGLVINQWRDQIGGWSPQGTPKTTPGGQGKNYAYFVRVEARRGDWLTGSDNKSKVGQEMKYYTAKNKSAAPHKTAHVDFYFEPYKDFEPGDFDNAKEVVSTALLYGVLENPAQGSYTYRDQKWRGIESVKSAVRDDVYLRESMEKEVRAILARKENPPAPEDEDQEATKSTPKKRRKTEAGG